MLLTIDRKDKLLEMCKAMYKECDLVSWSLVVTDAIHLRERTSSSRIDGSVSVGIYASKHIPWLEMCLFHLPKRLFDYHVIFYGKAHIAHHQAIMMSGEIDPKTKEPIHPIDYLWAMYKNQPKPWPVR